MCRREYHPPRELPASRNVVMSGRTAPCNKLSTGNGGVNLQPEVVPHLTREDFLAPSTILLGRYMGRRVKSNIQPDRGGMTVFQSSTSHQSPRQVNDVVRRLGSRHAKSSRCFWLVNRSRARMER